ncbi:hypothetical protein quinque_013978 [Culex quinquefasciatus]
MHEPAVTKQPCRCRYHHRPLLSRRSTICTATRLGTDSEKRSEDCLQPKSDCNPYEPVKYEEIQVEGIYAAPIRELRAVTVPSKILLKVRLIDYGKVLVNKSTELRPPLQLMKILEESARVSGGDRQFDQSTRGQRAYPDSDEEPCGIDSRELVEIIQPPVTPFLLDVQSDVGDKFTEGGIIGNLSSRTVLVMLNSAMVKPVKKVLYNQPELALRPWTTVGLEVMQMDISRVIIKKLEFKQLCHDQQARIMKATLTDVEKKGQLVEVTLWNVVCDLKQVDVNYWPHIPQGKSIVRITFVLDVVTLTVCPNVYSKLLLTILPE